MPATTFSPADAGPPSQPRLLVVEDEALVRELIVLELEDAGYAVAEAEDGPTAIRLLETQEDIALLFTDIRLPGGLTGWDIAEKARALRPGLPVIYTTGFSRDELRLVAGAHFLKKPYRPAAVLEAVGQFGIACRL